MSQKRHPEEDGRHRPSPSEGSTTPDDKRRKVPAFKKVVMDAVTMHQFQRYLEPLIRRVVREEVEMALKKHLNAMRESCMKETQTYESRCLKLHFQNNLSLPVFTGARIEGEELSALQVALVDCVTGQIVSSGPESLAKVEMVVLEGDFDSDEADSWTAEEFKNNIVREREGKKPLLTGDAIFYLKDGLGSVGEISFTDNSSWTRSRRFRLGVRVLDDFDGTQIREAKTDAFTVRDHRGELYKKHHPPSPTDEVWRLEKIGKDGAFHKRLSQDRIYTVKDFLTLLYIDPTRLRNILGPGMSAKMWEITIEHARKCVLEKRSFVYFLPNSEPKAGVVFNVVGQLMGLHSDGQYIPIDKLSETDRVEAQNMIIFAFDHWDDVVPIKDESSLSFANAPESSIGSKFLAPQKVDGFDFAQSTSSSPDIMSSFYSLGPTSTSSLEDYTLGTVEPVDLRYHDHVMSFPGQAAADSHPFCHHHRDRDRDHDHDHEDGHLQFLNDNDICPSNVFSFGSPSSDLLPSSVDTLWSCSPVVKAQDVKVLKALRRWKMLASVLKWFFIMVNNNKRRHVEELQKILVHGV